MLGRPGRGNVVVLDKNVVRRAQPITVRCQASIARVVPIASVASLPLASFNDDDIVRLSEKD